MAISGACEISSCAGEGTGDHAAYTVRTVEQFSGDFAHAVQIGEGNYVLVSGDLEDAVARSVDDGLAGTDMFVAEFFDDFGAGGGLVAESFAADLFFKLVDDFFGKAVRINRKGLGEPGAGHFPVTGGGVFAGGMGGTFSVGGERSGCWGEVSEGRDVSEAKSDEGGDIQRAGFSDVAEGVATDVAVGGGVGEFADADAVENDPDHAIEDLHVASRGCIRSKL